MSKYPNIEKFYSDNKEVLLYGSLKPTVSYNKEAESYIYKLVDIYKNSDKQTVSVKEIATGLEVDIANNIAIVECPLTWMGLGLIDEIDDGSNKGSESHKYAFTDDFKLLAETDMIPNVHILNKLYRIDSLSTITKFLNLLLCTLREGYIEGDIICFPRTHRDYPDRVKDDNIRRKYNERIKNIYGYNCGLDKSPYVSMRALGNLQKLGLIVKSGTTPEGIDKCVITEYGNHLLETIDLRLKNNCNNSPTPPKSKIHQQIFYGAPGTGKSFSISEKFALTEDNTIRTTFHPDTDYASFVGCYKPQSYKKNILDGNGYNEEQIVNCLFNSDDQIAYPQSIKARYWYEVLVNAKDIKELGFTPKELADKVRAKGFKSTAYENEAGCMLKIYDWLKEDNYLTSSNISYSFSPQVFTRAYIKAWEKHATNEPVFLVIDEINRGNCAQIFGDLFQLLDRDDYGYSDYEIKPDADLQNYIAENGKLSVSGVMDKKGNDISKSINDGSLLKLPNNLYILATMNTSDQSLFPMDSAFKRRWTWKYVKIEEPKEDDDKMFIELEDKDGKTVLKPWIEVITTINTYIKRKLRSSDKQIGYWFVKSDSKVEVDDGAGNKEERKGISIDQFRDKVLFFLFDDAFKDDEDFASLFGSTDYIFVDLFDEGNMKAKVFDILNKMEE